MKRLLSATLSSLLLLPATMPSSPVHAMFPSPDRDMSLSPDRDMSPSPDRDMSLSPDPDDPWSDFNFIVNTRVFARPAMMDLHGIPDPNKDDLQEYLQFCRHVIVYASAAEEAKSQIRLDRQQTAMWYKISLTCTRIGIRLLSNNNRDQVKLATWYEWIYDRIHRKCILTFQPPKQ